jgi:hypothetical protein
MVLLAAAWVSLMASALQLCAADELPLTDNQSPPFIGVWEPMYQGTGATDDFANWLNRQGLWPTVTQYVMEDRGGWGTADKYWLDPAWGKWVAAAPGRRAVVVFNLPTDAEHLASGAKGGFNDKAKAYAAYMVSLNLGNSVVCMGLLNDPNTWDVATKEDASNFVLYWQQVVTAMRSVPGADKLQFDWVGLNRKTSFPIEAAYPGDAYVDYIGMFLYDQCLDKSIYPIPEGSTDADKQGRWKKAWDNYYYPAEQNGLAAWMSVAKAHQKPFSLPAWCLYEDHYGDDTLSTGGDNTYFVQQMHDFIFDPANNVAFASYLDSYWYATKLSPGKGYTTPYPNATALFQKLFSLPAPAASPK